MGAPVDQSLSWRVVEERMARSESPRQRKMLQTLIDHLRAEEHQSLDEPKGADAVRSYYAQLVEAKRGVLEYAIERIVVDDDNVVTEGDIRAYQTGEVARGFGFDVADLDATYLVAYRAVILWPFNAAGEMLGEDGYSTLDPDRAERVAAEDLPAVYLAQFAS